MRIIPLAAESLGVRSMATYVEAGRTGILIDPGATLAESRFNLPPAEEEREALDRARDRIGAFAARAETVFISHYHEDHYVPEPAIYATRRVLAKDPRRMVAGLQARRAGELWRSLAHVARVESADGRAGELGDLAFKVSPPLAHGPEGTALGYCLALTLTDHAEGFRFVFASDVQGPLSTVAAAYLIRERPHLLYLSGPPSYLEKQLGREVIDRAIDNLQRVVDTTGCRVIMDHYALRDGNPRERFARLWEGSHVVTAAGYLGLRDSLLEAKRCVLWAGQRKPPAKIALGERVARRKPLARIEPDSTSRPRRWTRRAEGGRLP
jgi:predicted metallo-beta-lactamase superfamily hydrolase